MCGIHGLIHLDGAPVEPQQLSAMGDVTTHRGPDDEGMHIDGNVGIAMRRLSIIDLAGGHQPLSNADGTLWLVCNGEIYNYRELRAELQAKGLRFKTGSDSEVLLHGYEAEGDDFVQRLNGMFDFALWDARRRRLLIGRDRIGVKPLYVAQDGRRLAFATEAKALLQLPGMATALNREVLADYLHLGYVPAPHSIFHGIRKLPPATLLAVEGGQVREWRWWQLPAATVDTASSDAEWIAARAQRHRPRGAHADGQRRADRRLPVRRRRLQRRRRGDGAALVGPDQHLRHRLRGRRRRAALQRAALRAAGGAAVRHRAPRDRRQARCRGPAAEADVAHGRADRRLGLHHHLPGVANSRAATSR